MAATPLPEHLAFHWQQDDNSREFWVGDRPLPHWLADDLARQAQAILAGGRRRIDQRRELKAAVKSRLWRWGFPADFYWERLSPAPPETRIDDALILPALAGRALLSTELARMLPGHIGRPELESSLAELAGQGRIEAWPAISVRHFGRLICRRCGETEIIQEDCWHCGDPNCWTCPSCRALGVASGCRTFYASPRQDRRSESIPITPVLSFDLTEAQKRAANSLREFLRRDERTEFLIQAVCGAGKTEVVLAGITETLGKGARILLATPRREIARELAARLEAALPGLPLAEHHGGRHAEEEPDPAVTIATTHQCLRYYRAFDLVILDEVDAFPYHGSRLLYEAVRRARRASGRLVYLTATPPSALARRAQAGEIGSVYLARRPHGRPLPVPILMRLPHLRSGGSGDFAPELLDFLAAKAGASRSGLVFVPTVDLAVRLGRALAARSGAMAARTAFVHAADRDREAKREAFVSGRLSLLVTTTVLERGLTLGALNVYVTFADQSSVFDAAALVQMAGRAGRMAADPEGEVFFLAERPTRSMREAVASIQAANAEAGFVTARPGSAAEEHGDSRHDHRYPEGV